MSQRLRCMLGAKIRLYASGGIAMGINSKFIRVIDHIVEWMGAYLMVAMVAIVFMQVFTRYVFQNTPAWTQEIVLLLMMWFGFLSIVIGFRRLSHLKVTIFTSRFPRRIQILLNKLTYLLIVSFGILLIVEGYQFVVLTWSSYLPVTGLPQGVQYLIIPIAGIITVIYGSVYLFSREDERI